MDTASSAREDGAIAIERYQSRVPRFRSEFAGAIQQIHVNAAARGIGRSGAHIHGVLQRCQEEIRRRFFDARDCIAEALDTGWEPTDDQVKSAFLACFSVTSFQRDTYMDISQALETTQHMSGMVLHGDKWNGIMSELGRIQVETQAECIADLCAIARKRKPGNMTINRNSGNIVFQAGNSNVANVTQIFTPEVKRLFDALHTFRADIKDISNSDAVILLATHAEEELIKHGGPTHALSSLLIGIAQTVQTIGALPASYGVLHAAAQAVGIYLPNLTIS